LRAKAREGKGEDVITATPRIACSSKRPMDKSHDKADKQKKCDEVRSPASEKKSAQGNRAIGMGQRKK